MFADQPPLIRFPRVGGFCWGWGCGALLIAGAGGSERDLVTRVQCPLANDSITVDVGAVETTEIAQHERFAPQLDDAMLLRDDSVKQLNRVAGVPTKRVMGNELDDLLAFGCREQQMRHNALPKLLGLATLDKTRDTGQRCFGVRRLVSTVAGPAAVLPGPPLATGDEGNS